MCENVSPAVSEAPRSRGKEDEVSMAQCFESIGKKKKKFHPVNRKQMVTIRDSSQPSPLKYLTHKFLLIVHGFSGQALFGQKAQRE